jgi:serine/threonine protein kinase
MNTEPLRTCPNCQAPVPAEAPQGLCPKCLLMGVSVPTEAGQSSAAAPPPSLARVAMAFPQLEILEFVGQGGMGLVYKARQPHLDRLVALKLLIEKPGADPTFSERFNREARVLARLSHPHIVAVHDFGRVEGFFYLVMEFVDGVNLRQAMRAGRFTPQQAFALVPKICDALQYAHEEGVLHRDIKPENLLLDTRGRIKIADFGIAKLLGEKKDLMLTASGAAVGTPHYMAPEQLERPQDVDQRADIYSLGVVFYEMLTGELPIGRFAPPSEKAPVDPRVDPVVLRALEKERERRFQSAGEVKTRVESITASSIPLQQFEARATPGETRSSSGATVAVPPGGSNPGRQAGNATNFSARIVFSGLLVAGSVAGLFPALLTISNRHVPPPGVLFLMFLLGVPATLGTWLGWSVLRAAARGNLVPKRLWIARVSALIWPFLLCDVLLFLTLIFSSRVLEMHLFHIQTPVLTFLAAVFGLVGIAALNWSLLREWSRHWRHNPSAAPLAEAFSRLGRWSRPVAWGGVPAMLLVLMLLFRAGFGRAQPEASPMQIAGLTDPVPPPGYEIPPGVPPGNEMTFRTGFSVPAGYALTLTTTLWSNRVPVRPGGVENAVFVVSPQGGGTRGQVSWRLLGNGALADGAPLEISVGVDGTADSERKTFHLVSPQPVDIDWVGQPPQLWPPMNSHTKFLLVKGTSSGNTAVPPAESGTEPDALGDPSGKPSTEVSPATPVEWLVGIEARLDPLPADQAHKLQAPRIGSGTNWATLLGMDTRADAGNLGSGSESPSP